MTADPRIRVEFFLPARPEAWHRSVMAAVGAVEGAAIVDTDPDVAIDLDGCRPRAQPPLGVWRYGFGDGAAAANGAAGTLVRLYRSTSDPSGAVVLHEGWYRARTRDGWGTRDVGARVAPWCARVVRQLLAGRVDVLAGPPQSLDGCRDTSAPNRDGHVRSGASTLLTTGLRDVMRDWFTRQRWTVGVLPMSIEQVLQRGSLPQPAWLRGQPRDRFYADPFPLQRAGDRLRLLVEDYRYRSRRKMLTEIELTDRGELVDQHIGEGLPQRASYPFLLPRGSSSADAICIPETFRARRVSAFERNGSRWRWRADLVADFPAVDATLLARDGMWWMFCTKQGDEDQTDLHLFYASDWRGPWQPHLLNPVKSDTRSSRPAGACFEIGSVLYRPAQNCAHHYGSGITINRVLELTRTAFREEPVLALSPGHGWEWPDGLHTINSIGGITIVDGLRIERRLRPARKITSHV